MNILFENRFLAVAVLSILALISCKPSENTIVINEAPTTSENTDTTAVPQRTDGSFQQLAMGEVMPIRTLDPLFVENASGMRAVQLIFEGLTQYDENGKPIPAIAREWTATNDDQTYTFTLQSDLFYHDSNVFTNGLGRKLLAEDIQYVFERMAQAGVPDEAADLFWNIRGFEPYFQEQRQLMMASDRQLDSISGIRVENDSTITFSLVEPDQAFPNKLASPRAFIYPKEAVGANNFKAVGTGPFKLSQKRSDSLYILAKFENYRIDGQPKIDRLDIQTGSDETTMLNALNRGDIQLIPQLGPQQMQMVLDTNGGLKTSAANALNLYEDNGYLAYWLRYNTGADASESAVLNAPSQIDQSGFFARLPSGSFRILWADPAASTGSLADSLTSTYSADPFVRQFYSQLSNKFEQIGITFSMSSTRVQNRNTPLYMQTYLPYMDFAMSTVPDNTFAVLVVTSKALSRKNVQNIQFNTLPWWIDLRKVKLTSTGPNQ